MGEFNFKRFMNMVGYIALIFCAVALTLGKLISSLSALQTVAEVLAYIVTGFYAYFYVRSKRNIWFLISYIVAAVLVLVMVII